MVDMKALQSMAIGFGTVVLSVAFIVVLLGQLGGTAGLSNDALIVIGNGTVQVGSLVTTWGTIIVLGIVIVAIFVGIIASLQYLANRQERV